MTRMFALIAAPMILAGCATSSADAAAPAKKGEATVTLAAADGSPRGTATIKETRDGLMLHVMAEGLPEGVHGIHIHAVGRCDAPDFTTAGPHWNPTSRQHGRDNPEGSHHGDLPNITIAANGRGMLHTTVKGGTFADLFDADGASLVVHATADDYRTDPSGNSGGRIACGVIQKP